ncbi:MAG: hypothetical protein IPL76_00140 [Gemmatimonadetes bacterium]|nr:hypothetical protein [Gemmatimonadota bacterium]
MLELAANSGGELAESAREFLEYLAAYESMGLRVVDDPVTAWDAGTTRNGISYIDVGFHERHPDAFYLPLTIVHELGHQNTQRSGFFGLSETLALGSENVIREFLGWPARADHSTPPYLSTPDDSVSDVVKWACLACAMLLHTSCIQAQSNTEVASSSWIAEAMRMFTAPTVSRRRHRPVQ